MKPRVLSIDLAHARQLVKQLEQALGSHPHLTELHQTLSGVDKLKLLGIQIHRSESQTLTGTLGTPSHREVMGVPQFGGLLQTTQANGQTKRVWLEAWREAAVALSHYRAGQEITVTGHYQRSRFADSAGLWQTAEVFVVEQVS